MRTPHDSAAVRIVYRDDHLLVLDKPVGIATTAPDGGHSLFVLAAQLDPRAPALHPLSRLDTQVSGLVTFARTEHANRVALEARKHGALRRAYLGLATTAPAPSEGDWQFAIGLDPRDPKHRRALAQGASGVAVKDAHTHYRVHASAGPLTALDLWPVTGRTHQLRVHASAAGCPLAGDTAYDGSKRITLPNGRILSAGRAMLHCAAFRMPNPAASERETATRSLARERDDDIVLSLMPPEDMLMLWRAAGGEPAQLTLTLAPRAP
ncbi:MAG: Ribosomal large subunit pseudouridine synthase [Myxococcaceae bacterium]|nr:Ribosomal large subunit pseudouridine synthase [Myxococcaceae bacterium]